MENMNPVREFPQPQSAASGPDTQPKSEPVVNDLRGTGDMDAFQKSSSSKSARKRTKTGCLTCRQRRIKCGEEKPVCKNCIKSKRECKGYAQRLIFKNPLSIQGIRGPIPPYNEQVQTLSLTSKYESQIDLQKTSVGTHGPILAPKIAVVPDLELSRLSQHSGGVHPEGHEANTIPTSYSGTAAQTLLPGKPESSSAERPLDTSAALPQRQGLSNQTFKDCLHEPVDAPRSSVQQDGTWTVEESEKSSIQHSHIYQSYHNVGPGFSSDEGIAIHAQRRLLSPLSYLDDDDDDYYDVESDEETETQAQVSLQNFNQLSLIMASANRDEQQIRSFTTYLTEPNVLASYQPSFGSSPLNNPKTARIFLHFIHATGPILSIFERHPIDPSTMLGAPVPMAQQGLWTYTMPLKGFDHPALLQAILALSSLHIAYLQQAPITVSLKHYHYALKRVGKAVGLPTRRKQVGTLAATLLLAYYEVMTADHFKWNSHLAGSAQLVCEIDYAGITRDLRAQRRKRWPEGQHESRMYNLFADRYMFINSASSDDPFSELESSIDENIIGYMLGRAISYDQFGQVEGDYSGTQTRHFTRKDIESFRIQCDLYWWYCKQDFIQSIVSGGALFIPFSQWGQCPPRAGLGRIDAIYGSADHLVLLMGRLADFGDRDRKRKLKAAKASGSEWRPDSKLMKFMARFAIQQPDRPGGGPPNPPFGPPPHPTGAPGHHNSNAPSNVDSRKGSQGSAGTSADAQQSPGNSSNSSPGSSPMYGMVPSSGPPRLPPAFATSSSHSTTYNDTDNDMSYEEAEGEWESILSAFEMFSQALGPDFMPLPSDSTLPIPSPFGPALQYRTHNIGGLWALYYTGRILLHRLHPSMPPAMMMAAGVAAPTTAEFAQIIGKILAGIYCPQSLHLGMEGISPTLGSCLIEVAVPIFFAGVQYMDAAQRAWTIAILGEISRLTGWKSADAIARGCERAWTTAAKQGRGPPYQPPVQHVPSWTSQVTTQEIQDLDGNPERRFVTIQDPPPYLSWAMGILSLEDHIF